ncbi:MAG: deoxyribonuclease IV [Acidimicrobiales bacterium]
MLIGANVRASGGLLPALERGAAINADVVQIFTTSPRVWKTNVFAPELLEQYRLAQLEHPSVRATFCHASYLINVATSDRELLAKSRACLLENLKVATALGSGGLVLHLGSHRGAGFEAVVGSIAGELLRALDAVEDLLGRGACRLLMENAAGAGGTCGRDFGELAAVLEAAGGDERLGACLDTQHLFASGADYGTLAKADALVCHIDAAIGLDRLGCIHLNDSKSERGSNRDRHANVGDGLIGQTALGSLIGHPLLQHLPAILETPGLGGHGPGALDVAAARRVHAAGVRRWRRRRASSPTPSV